MYDIRIQSAISCIIFIGTIWIQNYWLSPKGKRKTQNIINYIQRDDIIKRIDEIGKKLEMNRDDILKNLPHLKSSTLARVPPWNEEGIERWIDHTLLKPNATSQEIIKLCKEAYDNRFYAVCVNGSRVDLAIKTLNGLQRTSVSRDHVKVAAVVGFPLGSSTTASKAAEAKELVEIGANEIDMVINIGNLLDGDYVSVLKDIKEVVHSVGIKAVVKVILETSLLSDHQVVDACILSVLAGAVFVKTSTGFGGGGATVPHVSIMKSVVGNQALVKASGGVRNFEDASALIHVGAARIGTSSGIAIIQGNKGTSSY